MKKLITEENILQLIKSGKSELSVERDTIITPSAMDKIRSHRIKLVEATSDQLMSEQKISNEVKTIAIGSDHTGYEMKKIVINYLKEKGYTILDVGTNS